MTEDLNLTEDTLDFTEDDLDLVEEKPAQFDEESEMSLESNIENSKLTPLTREQKKFHAERVKQFMPDGSVQTKVKATRSAFAQTLLYLEKGVPFRLNDREYLVQVYDFPAPKVLMLCGRQVEKSTSASAWSVTDCCLIPNHQILYVSPAADQTRNFSTQKIKPMMEDSPLVKKFFISGAVEQQVFNKGFLNGSRIMLRYSFLTADRIRGISASKLCIDEIQDILMDNIPVIQECISHSHNPTQLYTGTPKTFDNPLTKMWEASMQHEWVIKCTGCNYQNVLGFKNIGKKGPICSKCGKKLITQTGQWVRMTKGDGNFAAFRVTQLMVTWKQTEERWHSDIILPMEGPNKIAENVYYNEKLGQPFDSSDKPITKEELIVACDRTPNKRWRTIGDDDAAKVRHYKIVGGVDWGTGGKLKTDSGKKKHASFTALTLAATNGEGRFWPFYFKKYVKAQADPNFIRDDIIRLHNLFGVALWGVDWGFGWGINNQLFRDLPKRVMQFQYVPNQREKRRWDSDGYKFQLSRTMVMSEFFNDIKRGAWQFPSWEEFEWISNDILCIFKDFSSNPAAKNQLYYNHPLDRPDDFCHSLIYARTANDILLGRP